MPDPLNTPGPDALLATAIATLAAAQTDPAQTDPALAAVALSNALSTPLEQAVELPSNAVQAMAERRGHHRSETQSKVHSDPELRAFILARPDTMTCQQIAAAEAATFPPDRRMSLSSIHRFWTRSRAKR